LLVHAELVRREACREVWQPVGLLPAGSGRAIHPGALPGCAARQRTGTTNDRSVWDAQRRRTGVDDAERAAPGRPAWWVEDRGDCREAVRTTLCGMVLARPSRRVRARHPCSC